MVVDGEDDFVNMLSHVFGVLGMTTDIVRHDALAPRADALDGYDLVVVGPGPGDPRDVRRPEDGDAARGSSRGLLDAERPFLAVCLGHQTLSHQIGLDLVLQGHRLPGHAEPRSRCWTAPRRSASTTPSSRRVPASGLPEGVTVETDPATGDIHLVAGPHYRGVQFHAESILTQNGFGILRDLAEALLPADAG